MPSKQKKRNDAKRKHYWSNTQPGLPLPRRRRGKYKGRYSMKGRGEDYEIKPWPPVRGRGYLDKDGVYHPNPYAGGRKP